MICPFCREEIKDGAIICKHCKSALHQQNGAEGEAHQGNRPEWYYESNGKRIGPAEINSLYQLINKKEINRDTLVWKEGMPDWLAADRTELRECFSGPPPLSGQAINNTAVWVLAFAPLIGTILLEPLVGKLIKMPISDVWWVTIALNIILSYIDYFYLKQGGHDPDKLGIGAAWIVPVYLYKRAEKLKQNNLYFIVWIIMFLVSLAISMSN